MGDSADGTPVEERDRLQRELKEQEKLLEGYQRVGSFISLPVLRLTHQEGILCCEYAFCEVHVYRLSNTSTSICIDVTPLSARSARYFQLSLISCLLCVPCTF